MHSGLWLFLDLDSYDSNWYLLVNHFLEYFKSPMSCNSCILWQYIFFHYTHI